MSTASGFARCRVLVVDDRTEWRPRISGSETAALERVQLDWVSVPMIGGRLRYAETATTNNTDGASQNGGLYKESSPTP